MRRHRERHADNPDHHEWILLPWWRAPDIWVKIIIPGLFAASADYLVFQARRAMARIKRR